LSWRMAPHLILFIYFSVSVVIFGSSAILLIFKTMASGICVCVFVLSGLYEGMGRIHTLCLEHSTLK